MSDTSVPTPTEAPVPVPTAPSEVAGESATAANPVPEAPPSPEDPLDSLLKKWVVDYIYNSPVSQSVNAVNHVTQVAIPALSAQLTKFLKG